MLNGMYKSDLQTYAVLYNARIQQIDNKIFSYEY